jgi:PTH1 family peptidyl-tRNA hydrolase
VARRLGATTWKTKDEAAQAHVASRSVVLAKPLSYMNVSGVPLAKIARWWKTPPAGLLIVVDDLDLPFGRMRMRESGSSGGHNGLKSIMEHFGTDFPRLRVGIGRSRDEAIDHVLSAFTLEEERALTDIVDAAAAGALCWLERGPIDAMNLVNGWRLPGEGRNVAGTTDNSAQ